MKETIPIVIALALGISLAREPGTRLDIVVREAFFAGLRGDGARLDRAMKKCEVVLATEPRNPPALVWHGAGLYFQSGQAFRRGDTVAGLEMNRRGLKEMADAVALEQESLQTRIPRAAIFIGS